MTLVELLEAVKTAPEEEPKFAQDRENTGPNRHRVGVKYGHQIGPKGRANAPTALTTDRMEVRPMATLNPNPPKIRFRCPECRLLTNEPGGGQCPNCIDRTCGSWAEDEYGVPLDTPRRHRRRSPCPLPQQAQTPDERPHVLYRFWDSDGALLYVGITVNLRKRLSEHFGPLGGVRQWTQIVRITLQHYPSREAVLAAEAEAIANEGPAWNSIRYKRRARERAKATV